MIHLGIDRCLHDSPTIPVRSDFDEIRLLCTRATWEGRVPRLFSFSASINGGENRGRGKLYACLGVYLDEREGEVWSCRSIEEGKKIVEFDSGDPGLVELPVGTSVIRANGLPSPSPFLSSQLRKPVFLVFSQGKTGRDSLIRLSSNEIRLTTSGGILFPFFSIPQFPTGLLYLTSYLSDLFLFFSFPRFKEGKEDQESARKNFSQERILISLINLHIYTWVSSFVCIESRKGIYFFISSSVKLFSLLFQFFNASQSSFFVPRNFYSIDDSSFFLFARKFMNFPRINVLSNGEGRGRRFVVLRTRPSSLGNGYALAIQLGSEHGGRGICAHIIIQMPV